MSLPNIEPTKIALFGIMIAIFTCTYLIFNVIIRLVEESATTFRYQLRNATKFDIFNELSHFAVNFLQLLVTLYICFTISVTYGGVWNKFGIVHPIILILLFTFSIMWFSFLISYFFKNGKNATRNLSPDCQLTISLLSVHSAAIVSTLLFYVPFLVYFHIEEKSKQFFLVFPINAFYHAINRMNDKSVDPGRNQFL